MNTILIVDDHVLFREGMRNINKETIAPLHFEALQAKALRDCQFQ